MIRGVTLRRIVRPLRLWAVWVAASGAAWACGESAGAVVVEPPAAPPEIGAPAPEDVGQLGYRVVREFPHDPGAFTQGLFFDDGVLYESTGLYGESSLRRVELETGRVIEQRDLLPLFFGEGSALGGGRIVQLTWRSGIGFVYDAESFRLLGEFRYRGEGWGLTFDGTRFVMSDGTDTLRFLDAGSLRETGALPVTADGEPLSNLNELEWIRGEIWANIWTEDRIARIRPEDGVVTSFVDLSGILAPERRLPDSDVLNGIAWDPEGERLFVTGKKWPALFQIEVVER